MSLIHEIQESPRSGDQYVDSLAKTLDLFALTHTTEHDGLVESCVSTIRLEALLDLDSELTSRSDDESFDLAFSLVGIFFRNKELDDRNRECSRLARTGLSQSLEISTPENRWDRLCLDRCGRGISLVRDSSENRLYDREL
jgi:hypothetical protein